MSYPHTNRLINEKSPYLLQHAHNPVEWYPWGVEAFDLAKSEDKPIFLSIGYATCHWCHVMEEESFENPEVARQMNETFINIKVDREELPEIDSIYMEFAQALMASAGGWPLNVILTPELKPFFAVTYLPPVSRKGLVGLSEFISHIKEIWQSEERSQLLQQADKIVEIFEKASSQFTGDELPTEEHLLNSAEMMFEMADPIYGGIKGEPKFPLGYQSNFFLQFSRLRSDSRALFYVGLTLNMMQRGGIYDQLGGGFSRYSVDERWYIPHFEKMLYDNAILSSTYLDAWKLTKTERFKEVSQEILEYVLRDMTGPEGGFYSAEDADSEGHEGRYYTWSLQEIQDVLEPQDAEFFCEYYGVTPGGNFDGKSVLHVEVPLEELAEELQIDPQKIKDSLSKSRALLLKKRQSRPHPFKDDKILSSWNGLMIDAFAKAGKALNNTQYCDTALKAAEFIKSHLWKEGRLLRRYRDNEARFHAGMDEYAFLIKGLLTLFELGFGVKWLEWVLEMADILTKEFKSQDGAFYHTDGKEPILIRKCEFYDGAEPSGNAVHCENLLRLHQLTQDERYLKEAEDILKAARSYIETYPPGACYHLIALQRYLDTKAQRVVIALDADNSLEKEISQLLNLHYCSHAVFIWKRKEDAKLATLLPNLENNNLVNGKTAVYICRQDGCLPPLISIEEIERAIQKL